MFEKEIKFGFVIKIKEPKLLEIQQLAFKIVERDFRMRLILALFICFVIASPEVQGRTYYITATGTVKCKVGNQYEPLPLVKVQLVGNSKMADGRTDSNGEFSLTGSGQDKPDPKIKVVYDYSGSYGSMRIRNRLGQTRDHCADKKSYSRNVNFDIKIDDEHCRAYYRFYHCGLKYYYDTVGRKPPYGTLYITTRAVLADLFRTAYAPYTKIKLSHSVDPITCTKAKHEFAHTIRHYYDGTYGHFLSDAVRFWYPRKHSCTDEKNAGFAFNEGWAEYWAGRCTSKLPLALTIGNKRNIMCMSYIILIFYYTWSILI